VTGLRGWLTALTACATLSPEQLESDTSLACVDGEVVGATATAIVASGQGLSLALLPQGGVEVRPTAARASVAVHAAATTHHAVLADGVLHACDAALHASLTPDGTLRVVDATGVRFEARTDQGTWRVALAPDATVRGAGERTGPGERRGRTLRFRNTDAFQPTCQGWCPNDDPLYLSLPFAFHALDGVVTGWMTDTPAAQTWTLGDAAVLAADDGLPPLLWFPGPTPDAVAAQRHAVLGPPVRWPAWGFGWHQSRWGWEDDEAVRAVFEGYQSRGWPLSSLWFDIQAMDGFRSFTWDPVAFDGRDALLSDLHAADVRAVAILDPGLKADDAWAVWREAASEGHLLGGTSPYLGEVWPGPAGFPDFTAASSRAW